VPEIVVEASTNVTYVANSAGIAAVHDFSIDGSSTSEPTEE
jgi:hypothetical protein